ncbi:MAG: flavodoxin-dependent (E)-4-hydroxy-3-methylbut-2-enyl-diphosphate synthase [Anaerovoracaceae bacterium]
MRKITKSVMCGDVQIGGNAPVSIQSMTNTDTRNVEATLAQINALQEAGCHIVRLAVPDMHAVEAFADIRRRTEIPLVADIHFDYRLAIAAINAGADKIRINPGNIGNDDRVSAVVSAAKFRHIPIRIGVNSGSLEKEIIEKYGSVTSEGLAESVINTVRRIENMDFDDIVVSVKSSDVLMNYQTCLRVSELTKYPIHIGVTESGTPGAGTVKSSVGIGALLLAGVGDTIRVSLTGDPVAEIPVAREILRCTGHFDCGIEYVSCPTCSRCRTDLPAITEELKSKLESTEKSMIEKGRPKLTVAVMGCAVNGPGESKAADIGVACGDGRGVIFKGGKILTSAPENEIVDIMVKEIIKNI